MKFHSTTCTWIQKLTQHGKEKRLVKGLIWTRFISLWLSCGVIVWNWACICHNPMHTKDHIITKTMSKWGFNYLSVVI